MGYMVYMDENGDAEGNYTLIARKPVPGVNGEYGLYPVGVFQLNENRSTVPVLQFLSDIDWVGGSAPSDEPSCGFHGEKCVSRISCFKRWPESVATSLKTKFD
ncbi:guanylate cyclase 32E [Caerostris extrusa]|uniref:Guanylate cyclase 32E n=1 Tax=Caerostris extrusa TaxID=172846 RepID=A0AAV4V4D2_CAEEX|nr:guanylate cyclase 32E [Caerostris extrusa]